MLSLGIPDERSDGEKRVAIVPETVGKLEDLGIEVALAPGAGAAAGFPDAVYAAAGAIVDEGGVAKADIVVRVGPPTPADIARQRADSTLIAFLSPLTNPQLLESLAAQRVNALAMELIPRITRAQSMDALSSQATVAGYKAVLLAAARIGKFYPMLMTAAGTIPPAKVLVMGAGVAGLQAIATARRLGAVVMGYDVRPAVKEQVESLGAQWVGLAMDEAVGAGGYAKELSEESKLRAAAHVAKLVADADVVITTAQIPGKPAPRLITEDMIAAMKPGSVIVDLASESGGNSAYTQTGGEVEQNGVVILGPVNLPGTMPTHASQMYSRNLLAVVKHLVKDGALTLDLQDEITKAALVTHDGAVVLGRTA